MNNKVNESSSLKCDAFFEKMFMLRKRLCLIFGQNVSKMFIYVCTTLDF